MVDWSLLSLFLDLADTAGEKPVAKLLKHLLKLSKKNLEAFKQMKESLLEQINVAKTMLDQTQRQKYLKGWLQSVEKKEMKPTLAVLSKPIGHLSPQRLLRNPVLRSEKQGRVAAAAGGLPLGGGN